MTTARAIPMPEAPPARRWWEADPLKVITTVAIVTVVLVAFGILYYRNFLANLPEIGHARELDDDERPQPRLERRP